MATLRGMNQRSNRPLSSARCRWLELALEFVAVALVVGCGINKSRLATEQLVVSEAVDKAAAMIDFSALSGKKVYFDTQYLDGVNMGPNGNVKYAVSSLRQQMMAYDLRLQEKADTADYIVEGRIGVLANDGYEVTYGIPGSAAAASATALLTSVPIPAPGMPELSLGRRNHQTGTAKLGLFAYDRVTREPVWQAGIKRGASDMRDTWLLGLGPYQSRAKHPRRFLQSRADAAHAADLANEPIAAYNSAIVFERALQPPPPPTATPAASSPPVVAATTSQPPASAVASPPVAIPPVTSLPVTSLPVTSLPVTTPTPAPIASKPTP
jgi:hypothetical protein